MSEAYPTTPAVENGYRFAVVPEWVLYHPQLPAAAVRLYAALQRHGMDPASCYPSQARLARLTAMQPRSVNVHLRQLEAVGAIKRRPRPGTSTGYQLAGDHPLDPALYSVGAPASADQGAPANAPTPRCTARLTKASEREPVTSTAVIHDRADRVAALADAAARLLPKGEW